MASAIEVPGDFVQASTEIWPWAIDLSPELDPGDIPQFVIATLTDLLDGSDYSDGLSGGATIVGTIVSQSVSDLLPGHRYRLVITTWMLLGPRKATAVLISCPF